MIEFVSIRQVKRVHMLCRIVFLTVFAGWLNRLSTYSYLSIILYTYFGSKAAARLLSNIYD
jgi:hypothetical protein